MVWVHFHLNILHNLIMVPIKPNPQLKNNLKLKVKNQYQQSYIPPFIYPQQLQPQVPYKEGSGPQPQVLPKDTPPFFGMPYLVIPQPNGTSIVQPLGQMPYQFPPYYPMMPPGQFPQSTLPTSSQPKPNMETDPQYRMPFNPYPMFQYSYPTEPFSTDESKKLNQGPKYQPLPTFPTAFASSDKMNDPRAYFSFTHPEGVAPNLPKTQAPSENIEKFFPSYNQSSGKN